MDRKRQVPPALPAALGIAALATISFVATLFVSLYPLVMASSPNFESGLG